MGYIAHDTVIAATYGDESRDQIVAFRERLPEPWRQSLVGPVQGMANGDDFWAFMPDGSKEGWDTSAAGDDHREAFIGLLDTMNVDFVAVRWGGDWASEIGARIERQARP